MQSNYETRRFSYVSDAVRSIVDSPIMTKSAFHELVNGLSPNDLHILTSVYERIDRNDDLQPISTWVQEKTTNKSSASDDKMLVLFLFRLFDALQKNCVEPFASGALELIELPKTCDWSELPEQLQFVIPYADSLGRLQFEDKIIDYLNECDASTWSELTTLKARTNEHQEILVEYIDSRGITESEPARRLHFLLLLFEFMADDENDNDDV